MSNLIVKIKKSFFYELPIIRLYALLYLIGVFIGVIAAILLKDNFSEQAHLLFSSENTKSFLSCYFNQVLYFFLLFFLGLTVVGVPLIPIYPLYKGFSLGLIISLLIILCGMKGLLFGIPAFFIHNFYYLFLGYFICYSSTCLSISLFQQLINRGRHAGSFGAFRTHLFSFLAILILLIPSAFWESSVVPFLLSLI